MKRILFTLLAYSLTIQIGDSHFSAVLYDNASTQALLERMPLTLSMSELNGNEKYHYLSEGLPTDAERVGNISAGDLMLYGSDCLVLFYEGLSTAYSYTRLGYVEDVSGLAGALGDGSAEVTFTHSQTTGEGN